MIKGEKNITSHQYKSPCPPTLHDTVQTISIWKMILTQHNKNNTYKSNKTSKERNT